MYFRKYASYIYEYAKDTDVNVYTQREYESRTYYNGDYYTSERRRIQESYTADFGTDGIRTYESYTDSYGNNWASDEASVVYKGYRYTIYSYNEDREGWYRYDYSYSFDGICMCTVTYTALYDDPYTKTYCCCIADKYVNIKDPTCSQVGIARRDCDICGSAGESFTYGPYDHNWMQVDDYHYECTRCGLENANGASGSIIMEDLTERYGNGEYYVIGYYAQNYVEFTHYVAIVLPDGEEIFVDVEFIEIDGVVAFAFRIADIADFANASGYTDYDVRFTFVPYGDDGKFDYAITLT